METFQRLRGSTINELNVALQCSAVNVIDVQCIVDTSQQRVICCATMKTTPFSMRLPPELKARLQEMADAERRSLSNFIETKLWDLAELEAGSVRVGGSSGGSKKRGSGKSEV